MKTTTTVTLDADLMLEVRTRKINLSKLINDTLKMTLDAENQLPEETSNQEKIIFLKAKILSLEGEEKRKREAEEKEIQERIESGRRRIIR